MYRGSYGLVGVELSMFSRKLEAQLRYQQIPWYWQFKTMERSAEIEARTGTHFIPALLTPDKWMIHDTIAIGPLLDARFRERAVVPPTPLQRACCFILEDFFNHWLGRVCVHTRWCYPENVAWVGPRFGANTVLDRSLDEPFSEKELADLAPIGEMMYASFGKNVCEVNGVGPDQARSVRADYQNMLNALAAHLAHNDFLLGPRPCLADFALGGACKAHFITDPVPREWLGEHRDMLEAYTQRLFGHTPDQLPAWPENDSVPETLAGLLDYAQETYFKFASANIAAAFAGEKYYDYDYGFGPSRARTQKRLNVARLHVQDELVRSGGAEHPGIRKLFAGRGIIEHYFADHQGVN